MNARRTGFAPAAAMLFNSYVFIFAFLPVALLGFFVLGARGRHGGAVAWLGAASLFFYGWWNPPSVLLLLASIGANWFLGRILAGSEDGRRRDLLLAAGVVANLGVLGYYKYAGFLIATAGELSGLDFIIADTALPLAISFFTFQQIAFLVDSHRERIRYDWQTYLLFVSFFPQLIAGPIVHHSEVLPQFRAPETFRFSRVAFAMGATTFFVGLFKKAVLADQVARYATPVFIAAAKGAKLTLIDSWQGALAYTFQIYFDFSGYSDMALGLALLFGVRLPFNFDSPYQAANIIDFWRRWHITLSRFLRDYLYIPLGGNRNGRIRRYGNLMATMLLGGLWHGAGWTFVIWGGLHGLYLVINHAWRAVVPARGGRPVRLAYRGVTFFAVVIAWVFFRAESFDAAVHMLKAMAGWNGLVVPLSLAGPLDLVQPLREMGVRVGTLTLVREARVFALLPLLFLITQLLPNTQTWMRLREPGEAAPREAAPRVPAWRPSVGWALALSVLVAAALIAVNGTSEFLYFQF